MIRLGTQDAWAVFGSEETPKRPSGGYRYVLGREWAMPPGVECRFLTWLMLNPSTADHSVLDPTLQRVSGFSHAWGYAGFYILNAYAWRATDPRDLPRLDGRPNARAIGMHNDEQIAFWTGDRDVVVGWGKHCYRDRVLAIHGILARPGGARRIDCLGTNKDGSPRHPLYLPAATERRPWSPPA